MIRISELADALSSIDASFGGGYPKTTQALIQQLLDRLKKELTSASTDFDLMLIEVRSNLDKYQKQNFANAVDARKEFRQGVLQKYSTDLEETEIPRLVQIAERLKRLL